MLRILSRGQDLPVVNTSGNWRQIYKERLRSGMYSKGVIYMLDNDSMAIYQKQCQYAVYQAGGYQRKKRILPAFGAAFSFGGYLL